MHIDNFLFIYTLADLGLRRNPAVVGALGQRLAKLSGSRGDSIGPDMALELSGFKIVFPHIYVHGVA